MSGAHSFGPWTSHRFDGVASSYGIIDGEGCGPIAHVHHINEEFAEWLGDKVNNAEVDANARLIAAAPDLLAACMALIIYDERDDEGPNAGIQMMVDYDEALTLARAAIAKALPS